MKEWVCKIHDQEKWTCIEEQGYYFHMKNYEWDKLPKFLKQEEPPKPPSETKNPPTNQ